MNIPMLVVKGVMLNVMMLAIVVVIKTMIQARVDN